MRKVLWISAILVVSLFVFRGVVFADTVEGKVRTVDIGWKRIEISSVTDTKWVGYTEKTKWPDGVTEPSILIGRDVKITLDDLTNKAASVE